MTFKENDEVLKHFYNSACTVGPSEHCWTTLDGLDLSKFTFDYIREAPKDVVKPALVCLFLMCKLDDVATNAVFNNYYKSLDDVLKKHEDKSVLSYSLVISNILTSNIRRQKHLIDNGFHAVIGQYLQRVLDTGKDKLLIIWIGILCKLTNSDLSCKHFLDNSFNELHQLSETYFEQDTIFEKIYVLF